MSRGRPRSRTVASTRRRLAVVGLVWGLMMSSVGNGSQTPTPAGAAPASSAASAPMPGSTEAASAPFASGAFVGLSAPARLLDTRGEPTIDGDFAGGGLRAAGSVLALDVGGRAGLPVDVGAVSLNVTVTESLEPGYVTVFPCGEARPVASNVNFGVGSTVANGVIARVGDGGRVCLFTFAPTHVIVDVAGHFAPGAYLGLDAPARLLDTRGEPTIDGDFAGGGVRAAGSVLVLDVGGRAGLPASLTSVSLNVTVTESLAPGYVTVFPCGEARPVASNVNFGVGSTVANGVIARVGDGGRVCLFTFAPTHLVVDVAGSFASGAFVGLSAPARLLDTRGEPTIDGDFAGGGLRAAGSVLALDVGGRAGLPVDVGAVSLNVTVTESLEPGYVTVFPCGEARPVASNVNFGVGSTVANGVIARVGDGGRVCLFTFAPTHVIVDIAGHFAAAVEGEPHPAPDCTTDTELWSSAATWSGAPPAAGANVTIPAGRVVALDVSPPPLGGLRVDGTLVICDRSLALTARWILVHGELWAGSAAQPLQSSLTITLTGDDPGESVMGMGTRGIIVMGGTLQLHGVAPASATTLAAHAPAGAQQISVVTTAGWRVGDRIAIAPTGYFGAGQTEEFTVTSLNGSTVGLSAPLQAARWGVLQYVTPTGLTTNASSPRVTPPVGGTPTVLDERAEVVNLSRNVVVQSADDPLWQNQRFGAHVMVMELDSLAQISGIEMRRVGQAGVLGRYPMHWHLLSYAPNGTFLGDADGQYLRDSSIHDSSNRCITIHATNGLLIDGNSCVSINGHAVFLEDGVERRNVITDNTVLRVRNTTFANMLKQHELGDFGSSGFWLSNPDNIVTGNTAADTPAFGFWLAFADDVFGVSANVAMRPSRIRFGSFDDNTTHTNRRDGVMFDNPENGPSGTVFPFQYFSTTDGQNAVWPLSNLRRFDIRRLTTWKNGEAGIWTRATWATYTNFVSADNRGRFFAGAGADGRISGSLVIGTSLNDSPHPAPDVAQTPTAFASYHSAFDMRDNVVVNFPLVAGQRSGMFATDDYYIRAVDRGHVRNPGNLRINTASGSRVPRPSPNYALAGALWDPHGQWGPAGNSYVYDIPFLTAGAACQPVTPGGSGGVSCNGDYYGVGEFVLDLANERYDPRMPIAVTRYANAAAIDALAPLGTWSVGPGAGVSLGNMRHFAARDGGTYLLDFPGSAVPGDVFMSIENTHDATDSFILGVRFSGADPAQVYASTYYDLAAPAHAAAVGLPFKHDYASAPTFAALVAGPTERFFQDAASNVVWIKVGGDVPQVTAPPPGLDPLDDQTLCNLFRLRVH